MAERITDDEMWEMIGFIKVSAIRLKTLKSLKSTFLMPSEIAKLTGYRTTQISNALHDLKEKKLVKCMNEEARKGRIYQNTELGLAILKMLDED
ncbi:MarR family transcriptional regulator [Methanobrevibacter sp.]|uniref:MarR family transcriptional regulator n=1 Tax=Methanobrevibacter sp. TaxID=66852 RepID=UPI0025EBF596|nr:MarR family transcriptional regulator [Methanobrevibacter sp.]MBQ2665586.1 MarR family transcriptional regulator [Methanobrevibacter sp.]